MGEFSLMMSEKNDNFVNSEIRFYGLIDPKGELIAGGFDNMFQC